MHPITDKRLALTFLGLWAFLIAAHFSLLYFFFEFSLSFSIADSLIYNLLFASISLGIWYTVAYSGLNRMRLIEAVASHFSAAALSIFIWILIGNFIEQQIFGSDIPELKNVTVIRSFSGLLYYGIMALLYNLLNNYNQLKQKAEEKAELTSMLKEAEIGALRAQINPHFLFNSLNSISALTMINHAKAQEMIIKLSEFMRYSLQNNQRQLTTLEKELSHIRLYLEIEKVRFAEKLEVNIDCLEPLKLLTLPNMLLQPLVENAIKYGVYQSLEKVTLDIKCKSENEYLLIEIANTYDKESIAKKGTGTGLKNVFDRLSILYGRKDLITIQDKGNEFYVYLKIPQHAEN